MNIDDLKSKAEQLLHGALKHAGKAALATALVPLGSLAAPQRAYGIAPPTGPILSTVSPSTLGGFDYGYTWKGGDTSVPGDDFMLPMFSATEVNSIVAPAGWTGEVLDPAIAGWSYDVANDHGLLSHPTLYGPHPQVFSHPALVLRFHTSTNPLIGNDSLDGFGFHSPFDAAESPALVGSFAAGVDIVDPLMPNSPQRIAAQDLPEPSTWVVFVAMGMSLAAGRVARRIWAAT